MIDFTTVIALDEHHMHELQLAWRTWEYFKPEIVNAPIIIIYDDMQVDPEEGWLGEISEKFDITFIPWHPEDHLYENQREKMLTSFFKAVEFVQTPWYLKIDTDCIAINNDKGWLNEEFFNDNPVFVSNPWGYTKPNNTFDLMDDWGNSQSIFKGTDKLKLPYNPESDLVRHNRIISWVYFGDVKWTNKMSDACKDSNGNYKLPFPSQDTYMWYCAERLNYPYKRIKFKNFGFEHWHNIKRIKNRVEELLKNV